MTARGITHTLRLLRHGELTAVEHVTAVLTAAGERDDLDAYVTVAGEEALRAAAHAADARIRALGPHAWRDMPLLGVTVSVKDLLQTGDLPTTRGSLLPNPGPRPTHPPWPGCAPPAPSSSARPPPPSTAGAPPPSAASARPPATPTTRA